MEINYRKKFIILKNKYSNLKGYKAKGHIKLEVKGVHTNINVNIENAEADSSYSLVLVSEDLIELGKIYTDSYGRAKSELILRTDDFLQGELEDGTNHILYIKRLKILPICRTIQGRIKRLQLVEN